MKYRKKPVVIDALQWNGKSNLKEVVEFLGVRLNGFEKVSIPNQSPEQEDLVTKIIIHTLEGDHDASIGDYIIKGIKGEYYPCKPDIFEATYEAVTEQTMYRQQEVAIHLSVRRM